MKVRAVLVYNPRIPKWNIDGVCYERAGSIPEIVRDQEVEHYHQQGSTMLVQTKER